MKIEEESRRNAARIERRDIAALILARTICVSLEIASRSGQTPSADFEDKQAEMALKAADALLARIGPPGA